MYSLKSNKSKKTNKKKKEHKPGGFRDSRLRLNNSLIQAEKWNEPAIRARTAELAEKACKIWIYPEE